MRSEVTACVTAGVATADTVLSKWLLNRLSALADVPSACIVDAVAAATDFDARNALTSTLGQLVLVTVTLRSARSTPGSKLASPLRNDSCFAASKSAKVPSIVNSDVTV